MLHPEKHENKRVRQSEIGTNASAPYKKAYNVCNRDENETDTAGYRIIPYRTLMYFSRIRVVKIRDGYRTRPGNNPSG
jgi:hypothetical protein